MDDEEIIKILLKRACREIDLLDIISIPKYKEERGGTINVQRLAYADQLILLLNDFNEHLCSIELKGVINILNGLYRRRNDGTPISDGVRLFMTAFYRSKYGSVVFPSVDIIRNAVRLVYEDSVKKP